MRFEWDPAKSEENRAKHGIDFETARKLWLDEDRVQIDAPHPMEERGIIIGKLHGKLWTAVFTMRSNIIRLISVRRSREKEERLYEKKGTGEERD